MRVKVKFTLENAMKAQRRSRGIVYSSLNLSASGVGGQRLTLAALPA